MGDQPTGTWVSTPWVGGQQEQHNTVADVNEPGIENFNIKNFPAIQRLMEDPESGRTPVHINSDDFFRTLKNYKEQFEDAGIMDIIGTGDVFDSLPERTFEAQLISGILSPELNEIMVILLDDRNGGLLDNVRKVFPRIDYVIDAYAALAQYQVDQIPHQEKIYDSLQDEYMDAFGDGFESAHDFMNTQARINKWFTERDNNAPLPVEPWEMRIGASRFFVPPININVNETFKVGSLAGGALRQQNTPKFNSGHSETVIDMTLYFPNHESIWGYDHNWKKTEINFDKDGDSDLVIDKFISSLRGLITQFKYAPFLPVRNEYLNRTYDITGVALSGISIQTVEGFPFCIAVNLQMLKFNFKPYLPPISDFNQAIHWGRYRQYIGRAAQKLNSTISEGFLIEEVTNPGNTAANPDDEEEMPGSNQDAGNVVIKYESEPTLKFSKDDDWKQGKNFDIYYPMRTPAKIFAPDASDFRQDGEDIDQQRNKNAWEVFLQYLGIELDTNEESFYDEVQRESSGGMSMPTEREKLEAYLGTFTASVDMMFNNKLQEYIDQRKAGAKKGTDLDELERQIRNEWLIWIYNGYTQTPFFQKYLETASFIDGQYLVQEWKVPMDKVPFDWKNIHVEAVTVNMANNIVRLQLQMEEEPVHQHIGGRDSSVNVSMLVFGEDNLIRFRRVFDHINGLARLEHAHGTLGFLGIKNVLTALAGIKYVLPMSFEVETLPNYPHVYRVKLAFVDFDIFQQQREELSNSQQEELIRAFGKRNPFLRIKQLWGAFNAYPDFPLAVRDDEDNIVGHLNPDFYFRAYQTFDDDIKYWNIDTGTGSSDIVDKDKVTEFYQERANKTADEAKNTPGSATERRIKAIDDRLKQPGITTKEKQQLNAEKKMLMLDQPTANEVELDKQAYGGVTYSNDQTLASKLSPNYLHSVFWDLGLFDENQSKVTKVRLQNGTLAFGEVNADPNLDTGGSTSYGESVALTETLAEKTLTRPSIEGLSSFSNHASAYADASDNPIKHWELMMTDAAYRDISGRMIRAFPTFMLWLIDEGGRFAGVKLFDNFYGLQSVIDFSVMQSEDVLGDTLVLRLSNLYKKLSTPYSNYIFKEQGAEDEEAGSVYSFIDVGIDRNRNINSGTNDRYQVKLSNIRLKPGVRVHLRMGYSANPNSLQTVFNGTITEVRAGDIVEVVAQSDAIELSPFINTTNKGGHSGKIDGAFNTGLWMSEPRDLMVRLLSMGSSTFKESIAHATQGMVFSENKFGIRHFGNILYAPLTDEEDGKHQDRFDVIKSALDSVVNAGPVPSMEGLGAGAQTVGNVPGAFFDSALGNAATRSPMVSVMQSMWTNFFRKRDYEIFKRNIYPGNGMGIAQYLGGDTLDGGLTMALAYDAESTDVINPGTPTPGEAGGSYGNAVANASLAQEFDSANEAQDTSGASKEGEDPNHRSDATRVADVAEDVAGFAFPVANAVGANPVGLIRDGVDLLTGVFSGKEDNPILQAMGIAGRDEDLDGFDEVSFRAQTYMKSVWDIFQLCAALLPNYIVAVRPFEDRSTVFYGKPHWLYTSGLIPISTGVPPSEGPELEGPDSDLAKLQKEAMETANAFADFENQQKFFLKAGSVNPYTTTAGMTWAGGDVMALPTDHPGGAKIPVKTTNIGIEMHLPTSGNIQEDIRQHLQLPDLPPDKKHPGYMDKVGGGKGGVGNYDPSQESSSAAGATGAFGYLPPDIEQYYMNMPWPYARNAGAEANPFYIPGHKSSWYKHKKVLIYAEKTGKACVCAIGEFGPAAKVIRGGIAAGASPDVMHVLGIGHGDRVVLGFVDDATKLGPTEGAGLSPGTISATGVEAGAQPNGMQEGAEVPWTNPYIALTLEGMTEAMEKAPDIVMGDNEKAKVLLAITFDEDEFEEAYENRLDSDRGNKGALIKALGFEGPHHDFDNQAADNRFYYAFEYGAFDNRVPVWIAPQTGDIVAPGKVDIVGITARRLYDKLYNEAFAGVNKTDPNLPGIDVSSYDVGANFKDYSGVGGSGGRGLNDAISVWHEFREETGFHQFSFVKEAIDKWKNQELENEDGSIPDAPGDVSEDEERAIIARFMRFLWQEAYARAWLVVTTVAQLDKTQITGGLDIDTHNITGGTFGNDDRWEFDSSPVRELFEFYLVNIGKDTTIDNRDATGEFTKEAKDKRDLLYAWMQDHNEQGLDSSGLLDRGLENLKNTYDQTLGRIWQAISAGLSGLTALFRMGLMQLGAGLENVHAMQQQANILNKVFNDSIYYSAGAPGSLLRLADNPFTREYGEPVIEVREPFQRMHYLSSFQHIISNNITENLTDVPTVITATSDGQYPVTVYFDRGAPPERQVEKMVETGLFWDNARGSGFFGFLHPLLHPIEAARGIIKSATGSSDELTSKRVGLYHLKEGLKDIYMGELVVLGDPDIRPHDLVYLADVYERMYGMFEVEQVVHHFTPEMGFITSITPNALVTINDPTRWSMLSWVHSWFSVKNMRDDVKLMLQNRGRESSPIYSSDGVTLEELAQTLETQMMGHLQYAHGNSALIRDLASTAAMGNMGMKTRDQAIAEADKSEVDGKALALEGLGLAMPGVNMIRDLISIPWNWVKENLLDQQGCYIQYLNKDGQAMDAGLSYNQGVAVGRHHSITILPGILGLEVPTTVDGHKRITSNDLLKALGWNEIDVDMLQLDVSFWTSQTNAQILEAAGKSPDALPFATPDVRIVKVIDTYFDGDTFMFELQTAEQGRVRLAGVSAAEISHNFADGDIPVDQTYAENHIAYQAAAFLRKRLLDDPVAEGYEPTVAIRVGANATTYDRIAAVVFHNIPPNTPTSGVDPNPANTQGLSYRDFALYQLATQWPMVEWDSYMEDGRPYTINWEIIAAGFAQTSLYGNNFDADRGAIGMGDGGGF